MSLAEAELALHKSGSSAGASGSTSEDEARATAMGPSRCGGATVDSGYADAPPPVRLLFLSCMRLLSLVSSQHEIDEEEDSDSLNNPAELLRHAVMRGSGSKVMPTVSRKSRADAVACCLEEIQRTGCELAGIKDPAGVDDSKSSVGKRKSDLAMDAFIRRIVRAREDMMSVVWGIDSSLQSIQMEHCGDSLVSLKSVVLPRFLIIVSNMYYPA